MIARRRRRGAHGARDRHVPDRAVADGLGDDSSPAPGCEELRRPPAASRRARRARARERSRSTAPRAPRRDVGPHVELGPVREREHADALAAPDDRVEQVPRLGPLGRGSHWPSSSRKESMRSLARARSSSRRAPPKAASKPRSPRASSSVTVCSRLREGFPLLLRAAAVDRLLDRARRSAPHRAPQRGGRGTR